MRKKEGLIYIVIIILLSTISARSVNNMISTTIPLLSKYQLSMNDETVGLLSASFSLATLIATSLINVFLQSSRRRLAFILSSILVIPILVLFYISNTITIWLIVPITGILYGFIMPNLVTFASISGYDKKSSERLLNIYSTSLSLSLIIGPILETLLLKNYTYRDIFVLFLPLSLPLAFLSRTVKFPEVKNEVKGFNTLKNKSLIASILAITSYNIPFAVITTFIAIYAKELFNLSSFEAYSVFIPFFTLSFITRFLMSIKPFRDLRSPLLISIMVTIVGIIVVSLAPNYTILLVGMLILGIPHGSIFPISTVMISRGTNIAERNSANSFFLAYNNVLFTISPAIYGYLLYVLDSNYRLAFMTLLLPVIVSTILLIRVAWKDKVMLG